MTATSSRSSSSDRWRAEWGVYFTVFPFCSLGNPVFEGPAERRPDASDNFRSMIWYYDSDLPMMITMGGMMICKWGRYTDPLAILTWVDDDMTIRSVLDSFDANSQRMISDVHDVSGCSHQKWPDDTISMQYTNGNKYHSPIDDKRTENIFSQEKRQDEGWVETDD